MYSHREICYQKVNIKKSKIKNRNKSMQVVIISNCLAHSLQKAWKWKSSIKQQGISKKINIGNAQYCTLERVIRTPHDYQSINTNTSTSTCTTWKKAMSQNSSGESLSTTIIHALKAEKALLKDQCNKSGRGNWHSTRTKNGWKLEG